MAFFLESEVLSFGKTLGTLVFVACSDAYLLDVNRQFLSHDYYTDVITFPNDAFEGVSGDVLISIDRVRENALELKESYESELLRVVFHGLLHLLDYDDHTSVQQREMRRQEDKLLKKFFEQSSHDD